MYLKLFRPGLELVREAKRILGIAMGLEHPFLTGELTDLENMANEDPDIYFERKLAQTREKITESICSCCGHKKTIRTIEDGPDIEKPWEKDREIKKQLEEDSKFFNVRNNYSNY